MRDAKQKIKGSISKLSGCGRCECGKYFRGLYIHQASIRNRIVYFSTKENLWTDKNHPEMSKRVHFNYFGSTNKNYHD